ANASVLELTSSLGRSAGTRHARQGALAVLRCDDYSNQGTNMYRCPHCHARSISALSQLSPPFDGVTNCSACGTQLKVKRKFTNYLVVLYMLGCILVSGILGVKGFTSAEVYLFYLLVVGAIQVKYVEYEELRGS